MWRNQEIQLSVVLQHKLMRLQADEKHGTDRTCTSLYSLDFCMRRVSDPSAALYTQWAD